MAPNCGGGDRDAALSRAYFEGSDKEFDKAVQEYYNRKKVPERSVNHNKFWESQMEASPRKMDYVNDSMKIATDNVAREREKASEWAQGWRNRLDDGG